ncbi:Fc receptor-like protein 5 isoform X2 [Pelodiscus sinensis]|uniref:Fc receptor-like protein 5 isoform X2 n=1 Tax=Pelodiscus sinensis TaxID=13735 RepID=UPI003F6D0714
MLGTPEMRLWSARLRAHSPRHLGAGWGGDCIPRTGLPLAAPIGPRGPGRCQQRGRAGRGGCSSGPRPAQPRMELRGLCPVLACLQLLPRLVWSEAPDPSPAAPPSAPAPDPLPPPTLSLDSQYPVYYQGERLQLSCSAPSGEAVAGYRFYKARGTQTPEELSSPSGAGRLELRAETGTEGPYTCRYWRAESGQEIASRDSNQVHVTVHDPPAAPSLSLSPQHPVYLPGESITLTCSPPQGAPAAAGFWFSGAGEQRVSSGSSHTHILHITEPGDSGSYTCAYWIHLHGREIHSLASRPVSIHVTAPPLAPTLSLGPPHSLYLPGEPVQLSCSAPGAQDVSGYRFYKQTPEQSSEELPSPRGGPRLEIRAAVGDPGMYTCQYWSRRSGRELPSGISQPLAVPVTEPPPAPRIALVSPHPVFLPGDQVTLRCSAPPRQEVAGYRFYRQPGELIGTGVPDPSGGARLDLSAGPGTAGLYVCVYWARRAGRKVPSEKSRPVNLTLTDRPPKPSVSLSPDSPVYVSGDRVEIRCSAPPTAAPERFRFYQSGTVIGHQPGNTSTWQLDLQEIGTGNATRSFSCTYEQRIQGRPVPSHTSDPVSIPVFPAPAAPSLRLIPPHPLYVTGETVTAECVAPAGPYEPRAHRLQRDEEPGAEMPGPRHNLTVTPSTRGRYRCEYSTELHGRRLQSPPSPSVVLEVTDPPLPPELSMDPPSGAVREGAPLLLTCRAPGDTTQRRFHFYQDGAELSPPEPSASPERRFPQAAPNNSGNFTCGYEEPVGGRWILSHPSQAVNVAVAAWSLPIPLLAGCGGAAFALVLFFIVCLHRRKKEANLQHDTSYWKSRELRQSQMKRGSADNVHIGLQQKVGDWPQVSQDWGLLPKLQGEGPRLGRAAPKGHKEEDDADSGAEFEFPDGDPTYVKLNVSCSTFRQGEDRPAIPEHPYNAIAP